MIKKRYLSWYRIHSIIYFKIEKKNDLDLIKKDVSLNTINLVNLPNISTLYANRVDLDRTATLDVV